MNKTSTKPKHLTALEERYRDVVIPELKKEFGYTNALSVPRIVKVVVNVGVGKGLKDERYLDIVMDTIRRITGQTPVKTRAKISIAGFKIREGMVVGMMTTLRGKRMYDFLEKVTRISLPRIRDFRGIPMSAVDANGHLNIGFKEHLSFPEIRSDEVERIHGLQVTVVTTANSKAVGQKFFKLLGFPLV